LRRAVVGTNKPNVSEGTDRQWRVYRQAMQGSVGTNGASRRLVRTPLILGVVLLMSGCGGGGPASTQAATKIVPVADAREPSAVSPRIIVTRGGEAPAGCGARQVARRLVRLFTAANSGDPRAAKFFAPEAAPQQGWWGVNGGGVEAVTATDRSQFQRYVAARHTQRERYDLREVRVRPRQNGGIADIEVKLTRTATDIRRAGSKAWNTEGKGVFHCGLGTVVVWSVTTSPDDELTDVSCPHFSGRQGTVTACLAA
jgi:hypothetical protein